MTPKASAALDLLAGRIDLTADFYTLPSAQVWLLVDTARAVGYRKSWHAPGSTARMFFQYLARQKRTA